MTIGGMMPAWRTLIDALEGAPERRTLADALLRFELLRVAALLDVAEARCVLLLEPHSSSSTFFTRLFFFLRRFFGAAASGLLCALLVGRLRVLHRLPVLVARILFLALGVHRFHVGDPG